MHDAVFVRVLERVQQLGHDARDLSRRKTLSGAEIATELSTLDELHGDERHTRASVLRVRQGFLTVVVDRNDIWMAQSSGRLRFTLQTGQIRVCLRSCKEFADQCLQGNATVNEGIVSLVDDAHAAAPDLATDLVFSQFLRQRRCFGAHSLCSACREIRNHLCLKSISQTLFCTRRCTIVSKETPPAAAEDMPPTEVDLAPISIFSSV